MYEKSKEYLDFIGGQVHLLFANSSERSMVLIQTRKQLMDELDHRAKSRKVSFCPSPAANRKQRWDNGLELKEKIKDELRNVLETSVNSPHLNQNSPHRNRNKMEKWASMKEISKDKIYSKVKRSNSMINLGQNQPRKYSIDNNELRRFFSKKLPTKNPRSGDIDQSDNDLIDFFNWVERKSEIQFRLATPGGESYIQRPIRILYSWLQYDSEAQKMDQSESFLNLHHLQLSVLAADLRFKKILSQSILELNRRLTKKTANEIQPRDPLKSRDLQQQLEPITFSLPPPEVESVPLPVVSEPIEVRTVKQIETPMTNQKPVSPPPTPLPEIPVQSEPTKLQPTQIQGDQPVLLTQQMALLTQMVSLMQQNMMQNSQQNFQLNTQRSMSHSQNSQQKTFTARNPIFPKNLERSKKSISNFGIPLFERSKSHQPIKNVVRKPSFTRSQSSSGGQLRSSGRKKFRFLEVGKTEYQPTGSAENLNGQDRKSDRKFTFINPTKVKGHIKTKNKQKMIKLDRFLEAPGGAPSGKRVVSPRNDVYPKKYPAGPSEMLKQEDKENIPENHKNISNQNSEKIEQKKNLVLIDPDEIDRKEFKNSYSDWLRGLENHSDWLRMSVLF